jgi:hypothetical protein
MDIHEIDFDYGYGKLCPGSPGVWYYTGSKFSTASYHPENAEDDVIDARNDSPNTFYLSNYEYSLGALSEKGQQSMVIVPVKYEVTERWFDSDGYVMSSTPVISNTPDGDIPSTVKYKCYVYQYINDNLILKNLAYYG